MVDTAQKNLRRIRKYTLNIGMPQTAAVAAWTGVAALLIHRESTRAFLTVGAISVFAGLLALSIIDAYTHRVPRYVTGLMIVTGVPLIVLDAIWHWDPSELLRGFAGAVALFFLYSLIAAVSRGGFGRGDVMLAPSVGLLLAYRDWEVLIRGTVYTFVLAGVVSAALMAMRALDRRDHIAFVPYIAVGAFIAFLV
ncbi:MAG: prepilin peptidase [Ilumatobacteraceae bacterium]|nr:prepilin peptidase [Ilumatobacteraceae bacterium]